MSIAKILGLDGATPPGLDHKLLKIAHDIAQKDEHAPIVLLVNDTDVAPIAAKYRNDCEKDVFVSGIQRIAISMKAHTSIFIHEAWLTFLPIGESVPTDEEIQAEVIKSRAPGVERREALVISIEHRGQAPLVLMAPIGIDGGFGARRVGPFEVLSGTGQTWRMLDLLGELQNGEVV